jgi:hypothetical protein
MQLQVHSPFRDLKMTIQQLEHVEIFICTSVLTFHGTERVESELYSAGY